MGWRGRDDGGRQLPSPLRVPRRGLRLEDPGVVPEKPAISIDELARMLLGAEANAAEALEQQMLSRLDEQTFVGGKHVARQQLPDLPEHAEATVHRVKVSLKAGKLRAEGCCQGVCRKSCGLARHGNGGPVGRVTDQDQPVTRTSVARSVCHLRREASCHIPGSAGRNSKGGSWV